MQAFDRFSADILAEVLKKREGQDMDALEILQQVANKHEKKLARFEKELTHVEYAYIKLQNSMNSHLEQFNQIVSDKHSLAVNSVTNRKLPMFMRHFVQETPQTSVPLAS